MKVLSQVEEQVAEIAQAADVDPLVSLVIGRAATTTASSTVGGIVVGELIGMTGEGLTPLVVYPGQSGSAAIAARSVVDLRSAQIGKKVVLAFDGADPGKPIVLGVVRSAEGWPLNHKPAQVEVDADGERLTVTAKEELVLQCGKASITLTRAGKVLIQGTYVLSRSSGANRIKGGSVQIN
jgi:Domain of unknown function (DUF6484)